ncbi:MAG TPA: M23 family metallopeptidase [Spirochaetota bacterium]|nr:M23 family metallopeptidase [Spirochaetota bacterium]
MNKKIKAGISAAIIGTVMFLYFFGSGTIGEGADAGRIDALFSNEEAFIQFIRKNVTFQGLTLHIVTVKRGDNFWKLAKKHGVDIDTLIGVNPFWGNLLASVNQKIVIPSHKGVLHFVTDLDDVQELAALYDASPDDVVLQDLPLFYRYYYKITGDYRPVAVFIKNVKPKSMYMTASLAKQYRLREMFRSPLGGRYSSFFGMRTHPIVNRRGFHNGIDIATAYGTPVGAACGGTVTAAGWMGGYGKAVVIVHREGYKTLYGHLSRIFVRSGQTVTAGRILGRVGSTGFSTGPHLHFTLWKDGKLINPMSVLW